MEMNPTDISLLSADITVSWVMGVIKIHAVPCECHAVIQQRISYLVVGLLCPTGVDCFIAPNNILRIFFDFFFWFYEKSPSRCKYSRYIANENNHINSKNEIIDKTVRERWRNNDKMPIPVIVDKRKINRGNSRYSFSVSNTWLAEKFPMVEYKGIFLAVLVISLI